VEIYTQDYYTGDPDNPIVTWDVHDNQRRDWWGNPVVPSWYTEASLVLDLDGTRSRCSSAAIRASRPSRSAPTASPTRAHPRSASRWATRCDGRGLDDATVTRLADELAAATRSRGTVPRLSARHPG
jgi:hypothetical protein